MKKWATTILLVLLIVGGLGLLLYPTVSNLLAQANQSTAIQHYQEAAQGIAPEEKAAELAKAQAYNDALNGSILSDPFSAAGGRGTAEYNTILDIGGVMGYVEIPKIGLHLAVYHGTSDEVLSTGVGHLPDSSLPIGGESAHAVLTGHRGLPSAKLFTDLDKLEPGDTFSIFVLGDELRYEVDDIQTVEPWDTSPLRIFPGEDHVTLLTCTPYGINSHRLLIRGARVALPPGVEGDTPQTAPQRPVTSFFRWEYTAIIGAAVTVLSVLGLLLWIRVRRRRIKASREWMDTL